MINFNSKFFTFVILIIFICSISAVSADDVNETVVENINYEDNVFVVEQYADGSYIGDVDLEDNADDLIDYSECSSIVLQVSENEGVISARRDATNAATISFESGSWGDIDYLKQYKTSDGYFAHVIVTSNGWLIGNGGVTDGSEFRQIEAIASEMVTNNVISDSYLSRIHSYIAAHNLGHFVIKAADGTYGVVFPGKYHVSKLEPGQFVVCPNVYSKSQRGSYDTSLNPVDAAIRITYTDSYGVNRRNIGTYHWKLSESATGLSYSVDCYVSNDNGAGVGRSPASLADNVNYFGKSISRSSIPVTPGKMYLGTHVFDRSSFEVFKLLNPVETAVVGQIVSVNYKVSYVAHSNPVVRFALPVGFDLNSVVITKGTYTYDEGPRVLTWYLNDCDKDNYITLFVKAVQAGNFVLSSSLNNKYGYGVELHANSYGAKISASNVNKYYKGPENLNVYLKDVNNQASANEKVIIGINGVDYKRTTNNNGLASIALNLNPGDYDITARYDGRFGKNSTTAHVKISKTISGEDIVKMYRNDTQYWATFIDTSGNALANGQVSFNINGVFYTRTTDGNGRAKLNINLNAGTYIITAINSINGDQYSNTIKVLPILVDGHDLTKYYRNASVYSVKVLDDVGNPLSGADVLFNINGIFYTRTSNESGYANLNLRLQPDTYIVTAEYKTFKVSNFITVLPVLFANDTVSYTDESNFCVKLIDGHGNPYANQSISFNINGVSYTNMTDDNGIANLFVNLANGKYIVTSTYDEYSISNTITIRNES